MSALVASEEEPCWGGSNRARTLGFKAHSPSFNDLNRANGGSWPFSFSLTVGPARISAQCSGVTPLNPLALSAVRADRCKLRQDSMCSWSSMLLFLGLGFSSSSLLSSLVQSSSTIPSQHMSSSYPDVSILRQPSNTRLCRVDADDPLPSAIKLRAVKSVTWETSSASRVGTGGERLKPPLESPLESPSQCRWPFDRGPSGRNAPSDKLKKKKK